MSLLYVRKSNQVIFITYFKERFSHTKKPSLFGFELFNNRCNNIDTCYTCYTCMNFRGTDFIDLLKRAAG